MTHEYIDSHLAELSASLLFVDRIELDKAVGTLRKARESHASVWIVGNGGSAATASHFANDLSKMCGVKAFSIPDMVPAVTAFGNDEGWDNMFAHTVDVYFEPGDVIIAISCSGRSVNVVSVVRYIPDLIIMTGNKLQGNDLAACPNKSLLIAPNDDITVQEDIHLAMCHAIAKELRG